MWNGETFGTGLANLLSSPDPVVSATSYLGGTVVLDDPFKSLGGEHVCPSKKRGCIGYALLHDARFRPIFEEAAAAAKAVEEREDS